MFCENITIQKEMMHGFYKARIIIWDIVKYKAKILLYIQKY